MIRFDQKFLARAIENWEGMIADEIVGFLQPKCQQIITEERLRHLLDQRKLRVKFGIDPTATDVHLGHVVPILVLNIFARTGNHVDLIIGDFTARVGDPTERDTGRVPLSPEKIAENKTTYVSQIGKYLSVEKVSIHHNTTWLNPMSLSDVFGIFQSLNLAEALQREDFRERGRKGQGVSLAEVCYGVLMGIDSLHLQTDVEVGGIDQLLNFQQCRTIMRNAGLEEEVILMTPIIEGTSGDGRKMSKSYNNYIAVNSSQADKFGKIMSIPDRLIFQYFLSFADVHQRELDELRIFVEANPFEAKKQLATVVASLETKNPDDGLRERDTFERLFSQQVIHDDDYVQLNVEPGATALVALYASGKFQSKAALRRLFEQNAVRSVTDSVLIKQDDQVPEGGWRVRVGRRMFFKIDHSIL
ncbi:MAG: Tyrosine--tRNA ligase [Parcubacteria group bacterium]|nr:Tyrosine--tRNA ligase [Parcubacteria group bacterium]